MYHALSAQDSIQKLNSNSTTGLSYKQVKENQLKFGLNKLKEPKGQSFFIKFLSQFNNILVVILLLATIISFYAGETLEAVVILIIVLLNGVMGFVQEVRAENSIEALKKLSTDKTRVLRESKVLEIKVEELVPGDIILLEAGNKIPADCRIIESYNTEVNEAILTGESLPVKKIDMVIENENISLGDRKNILFKDTTVTYGRAKALVFATGIKTEIGKISTLLEKEQDTKTPLTIELNKIGKKLSLSALAIISVIFAFNIYKGENHIQEAFLQAISLAVAAIPEGLPAVVTITLAIGVSRLAKHKAIMRKLQAVETLGSTNYILTDKTGTLTKNQMQVTNIQLVKNSYFLDFNNKIKDENENEVNVSTNKELDLLIKAAILCNDGQITIQNEKPLYIGDSTETALLKMVDKNKVEELKNHYERVFEIPFTSETKRMLVVVKNKKQLLVFTKGASEAINKITPKTKNSLIETLNNNYANEGLRSLAFSYKKITPKQLQQAKDSNNPFSILGKDQTFLGLVAQKDPLRPEVKPALQTAFKAGIKTIVLTGDHKLTATNIAKELGLIASLEEVMDGEELGETNGAKLKEILQKVKVFARVSPEQKLRIVNAVKEMDNIVAVTGDGVNDAPAIKAAHIGIAMGISGTDVSKEVSDMILEDDNYATIVEAIKQGRIVFDNLIKFVTYLISCNISEILLVSYSVLLGLPLPLLPIHILWINLVTDGFPALSLGLDPEQKDLMEKTPRNKTEGVLTYYRWVKITSEACVISLIAFFVFLYTVVNYNLIIAQTATMTALAVSQLLNAYNNRSQTHSIFSTKLFSNIYLHLTVLVTFILQLGLIFIPLNNIIFKTTQIPLKLLVQVIALSFLIIVFDEFYKLFIRKSSN